MSPRTLRYSTLTTAALWLVLSGCSPKNNEAPAPSVEPKLSAIPIAPPAPPPPLDRAALIGVAAEVASAKAAGGDYPKAASDIAGRAFRLSLPFGCTGPLDTGAVRYSYDPERQTLKLTAQPEIWSQAEWARELVGGVDAEAIEGFWIRRPWLLAEGCPAPGQSAAASAAPETPAPETLAMAQAFAAEGSRVLRRGRRPYETTYRLAPGEQPSPSGYRLVLQGRLASGPDGPIRCRSESADERPVCLIRVEFDRVAFETVDGAKLAEWLG